MIFGFGDLSMGPKTNYVQFRNRQSTPKNSTKNPKCFRTRIMLENIKVLKTENFGNVEKKTPQQKLHLRLKRVRSMLLHDCTPWPICPSLLVISAFKANVFVETTNVPYVHMLALVVQDKTYSVGLHWFGPAVMFQTRVHASWCQRNQTFIVLEKWEFRSIPGSR